MKSKKSAMPTIDLTLTDFVHEIPEEMKFEIIIHWKKYGHEPESINPVKAFGINDGKLKIINRNLPDTAYTFYVKDVKRAFLIPMEM